MKVDDRDITLKTPEYDEVAGYFCLMIDEIHDAYIISLTHGCFGYMYVIVFALLSSVFYCTMV